MPRSNILLRANPPPKLPGFSGFHPLRTSAGRSNGFAQYLRQSICQMSGTAEKKCKNPFNKRQHRWAWNASVLFLNCAFSDFAVQIPSSTKTKQPTRWVNCFMCLLLISATAAFIGYQCNKPDFIRLMKDPLHTMFQHRDHCYHQ